jgi:hypothetical protein
MDQLLIVTISSDISRSIAVVAEYGVNLTASSASYVVFVAGITDTSMSGRTSIQDAVFSGVRQYNESSVVRTHPDRQIANTRYEVLLVPELLLQDIYVEVFSMIRRLYRANGLNRKVVCDYTLGSANVILATVWAASCFTQDICVHSASRYRTSLASKGSRTKSVDDIYTSNPLRSIEVKSVPMLFITLHEEVEDINLLIQEMHYSLAWQRVDNLYVQVDFPLKLREVKMMQWLLLLEALMFWDNFQFTEAVHKIDALIDLRKQNIPNAWSGEVPKLLVDVRLSELRQYLRVLAQNRYRNVLNAKHHATVHATNLARDLLRSVTSFTRPTQTDTELMNTALAEIISSHTNADVTQRLNEYRATLHVNNMHGYEFIIEMVMNAERRAHVGHFAEAYVRLISAIELLPAVRLLLEYAEFCEELNSIEKQDLLGRIFNNTRSKDDWNNNEVGESLERYHRYRMLRWIAQSNGLEDDVLAEIFLRQSDRISTLAAKRNEYIHGYGVITRQDFESLHDIMVQMIQSVVPLYQSQAYQHTFLIYLDFINTDGIMYIER